MEVCRCQRVSAFTTIAVAPFPIQLKVVFMPWGLACCFLGYFSQKPRDTSFSKRSIADCLQVGWKGQRATGLSWRHGKQCEEKNWQDLMPWKFAPISLSVSAFLEQHQLLSANFYCFHTRSLPQKSPERWSRSSGFAAGCVAGEGDHCEWNFSGTKQLFSQQISISSKTWSIYKHERCED